MGKGGGGGGSPTPQTTTAYQTNLPEYAQPYVMNMLGAAQRQLFETSGDSITGFRPYTPYSTDPTKYFAPQSSLQTGAYNEAAGMQTPGQFAPATGLAGAAGLGALGAGQRYQASVMDPRSVQSYMSPFMQNVVDVQKAAAVREAQLAENAAGLAAARQGTYGGARQALARAERERNLLSNLSNIQAQGSQNAYNQAIQNMQFGANLGLQGMGQATGAASALGQLGGAQQQSDIARIGLQNQLGQQAQQYQQNIINQAIQDYATAQQYPYMQLSTMSNLLRGLPMQSMSTQIYQAQPSASQQALGLLGTGASLYGAFGKKEGGQIKEYAAGGGIRASLENRLDDIAEAGGVKGLQKLMTETQSPEAKRLIAEKIREMGIAAAPTGDLGRNMAGGGIVAFANGDLVEDPMMQFSGFTPEAMAADEMRVAEAKRKKDLEQYNFLKEASPVAAKRMLERDPSLEPKVTKTAAAPAAPVAENNQTPPAAPAAPTARQEGTGETGLAAVMAQRNKLLGFDGPGEKSQALMKALEERSGRLGKEAETDRYLRMAQAFAQFGSTAGPIGKAAASALGEFAKGEGTARKEQEKMQLEVTKMQADIEKAQRAEKRGDLEAAEKFYNSAKDRENRINVANASANRQVELIERAMNDPEFMNALRATKGLDDKVSLAAMTNFTKWESGAALTDPEYRKRAKAAKEGKPEAVQAFNDYREQKYNEIVTRLGSGNSSKTSSGSGKVINYSDIK